MSSAGISPETEEMIESLYRESCERFKDEIANGADVNCADSCPSPLEVAVCYGTIDKANYLVSKGARVPSDLILGAAAHGDANTVKWCLEQGNDIEVRSEEGDTPLSFAISMTNTETMRYLLEQGADIDAGEGDRTPRESYILAREYGTCYITARRCLVLDPLFKYEGSTKNCVSEDFDPVVEGEWEV